jgi:hypothetical protein
MSNYPLPPISTLSAALTSQSVPIAPELMGAEGLPPKRRGSDPPSSGYAFQSSSARDEGHWAYPRPQSQARSVHPWEDGYRDHGAYPPLEMPDDESPKAKPRKRARVSKGETSPENDLEGEHDFEHPSGDFRMGPVFVHPPKGTAQACVRCHRIKRKCDNARPRCAGCGKADVACVFELSPATSTWVLLSSLPHYVP